MDKKVWVYRDAEPIKVFATAEDARAWFEEHDPEGVAFEEQEPVKISARHFRGYLETDELLLSILGPELFRRDGVIYEIDYLSRNDAANRSQQSRSAR